MTPEAPRDPGWAGRFSRLFIDSRLTPLLLAVSLSLGLYAVLRIAREEEPQIRVPMVDVSVETTGDAAEIESRITRPLEQVLWELPAVEYLYSTSGTGRSLVIVRFRVGTDIDAALDGLDRKLRANASRLPPEARVPVITARTIDDVPVFALTLHSARYDPLTLRRIAVEVAAGLKAIPGVAETRVSGGARRTIRVELDPAALVSRRVTAAEIAGAIEGANVRVDAGSRPIAGADVALEAGSFLRDASEIGDVVVGGPPEMPVHLREVAAVADTTAEPAEYVYFSSAGRDAQLEPGVTISVAKQPGVNAVALVDSLQLKIAGMQGQLLPPDLGVEIVRDYGHTAAEKSNELLEHMGIAVAGVALLVGLFLGWRESFVVLLAIPSTLGLTLFIFYLYGYTLNRITLFALIFSIGILVDDAIVVIENIVRHLGKTDRGNQTVQQTILAAVDEVGNSTILATWAVIAAILPMGFVGGLMGPYMRPIPVGASAAMLISLGIAFAIAPWAAVRFLRARAIPRPGSIKSEEPKEAADDWTTRLYRRAMVPLLERADRRALFLGTIGLLLAAAVALVALGAVKIKMLPFDNKSEFQVVIHAREGSTLEDTTKIALEMGEALRGIPEVRDYQVYAGTSAPFNFNGLVRHYYLRSGPAAADLQVNLVDGSRRAAQSHAVAQRLRPALAEIAARHGATVTIAEVPPGPPVLQTIVAEVYGPDEPRRLELARTIRGILSAARGVVDVDWYVRADQAKVRYAVDGEKAARLGLSVESVARTLQVATTGSAAGFLHLANELEEVPIAIELPAAAQEAAESPLGLQLRDERRPDAPTVPLSEIVTIETTQTDRELYRKNLKPVTYVVADVAGEVESPAYALLGINREIAKIDARQFGATSPALPVFNLSQPFDDSGPALKWDGEWHITLEVFRDLGLAFAAVLALIALLMVGWFRSYRTPLVVMAAIPFSLVGILPAHWALGAFFTATSMIGFMAGAGIVVRNSIILVDFIEQRRREGQPLRAAVIEAGAARFRPMLLTALAVAVGASVILTDPIFQGLAISLIFGEIASLLISRMAVPVLYFLAWRRGQ